MRRIGRVIGAILLAGVMAAIAAGQDEKKDAKSAPSGTIEKDSADPIHFRVVDREGKSVPRTDAQTLKPLRLEPAGQIAGTVTDAVTGKPIGGATVSAELIERRRRLLGGAKAEAVTDDKGRFAITGLLPGVFDVILANVPGREAATARAAEYLRVRAGFESQADITVDDGRPLRGIVMNRETGRPVTGAIVGCYGPARPETCGTAMNSKTDQQGRFAFHVPPGEHDVYLADLGANARLARRIATVPAQEEVGPILLLRSGSANGAQLMPMVARRRAELVAAPVGPEVNPRAAMTASDDPSAPPQGRTVNGHVRDEHGRPLAGLTVEVMRLHDLEPGGGGPESYDPAVTDRDGLFILGGLLRRQVRVALIRSRSQIQRQVLPADRDQVELTYKMVPDGQEPRRAPIMADEPVAPQLHARLTFVELDSYGSNFLADGPGDPGLGNDLDRLPRGVHKLGDTYFRIGEKFVQVKGTIRDDLPRTVKAIKVQARARLLHVLHSTEQEAAPGTLLGAYIIRFADGTNDRIPIIYGKNLVNWWKWDIRKEEPTAAQVAWTGSNEHTDTRKGLKVRLYSITWTNPYPEKEIATFDVLSSAKQCDPFLVAVTLER